MLKSKIKVFFFQKIKLWGPSKSEIKGLNERKESNLRILTAQAAMHSILKFCPFFGKLFFFQELT